MTLCCSESAPPEPHHIVLLLLCFDAAAHEGNVPSRTEDWSTRGNVSRLALRLGNCVLIPHGAGFPDSCLLRGCFSSESACARLANFSCVPLSVPQDIPISLHRRGKSLTRISISGIGSDGPEERKRRRAEADRPKLRCDPRGCQDSASTTPDRDERLWRRRNTPHIRYMGEARRMTNHRLGKGSAAARETRGAGHP
jgi:hypothetical protein